MTTETEFAKSGRWMQPRQLIYLAALALVVFVLLPKWIGFDRVRTILSQAQESYLLLALGCEICRYFLSAGSTGVLSRLFGRKVPYSPLLQIFFAGGAANRIVSTGGAPGMVLRAVFLARQGLPLGSVAVLFLIEDIAGLVVGSALSLIGIAALVGVGRTRVWQTGVGTGVTLIVLVLVSIFLYRRRLFLEQSVHATVRMGSALTQRLFGRAFYEHTRVQRGIEDFYTGVRQAWHNPSFTVAVFLMNVLRFAAGAFSLYFAFLAFNWPLAPAALLVLFASASMASSVSAVPAEAAIMGTGLAILSHSLGVPKDAAMVALLASRTIYFWLPIPLGCLAFWNLRRQRYL